MLALYCNHCNKPPEHRMEYLTTSLKQTRATLRKITGAGRHTGAYQRAARHAKDAAMLLKRGCIEAALEKAALAREAAANAEALAGWAKPTSAAMDRSHDMACRAA
jgi:hypothetical protein